MSARASMKQRTTIERNTAEGVDPWNNPTAAEWSDHVVACPCWTWHMAEAETVDGVKNVVLETRRLMLPLNTDVTTADRLASITDRQGRELVAGPIRIDAVGRRTDHLLLTVVEVSDAG